MVQQTLDLKWSIDESNEQLDLEPNNVERCAEPCTTCRGTGVVSCQFCNGCGYVDFGTQERGTVGQRMMRSMRRRRRKEKREMEMEMEMGWDDDSSRDDNAIPENNDDMDGDERQGGGGGGGETMGVECPVCDENGEQTCNECKGSGWIANWRK